MKFLPLLLSAFGRHKLRTSLTILSIVVSFVLFGYLSAIRRGFEFGAEIAGADRLIIRHKTSLTRLLPRTHQDAIRKIEGVAATMHSTFLVGIYREPANIFPQFAVDPAELFEIRRDYRFQPAEREAWLRTRTGAVVGRSTAERYGFKVGDRIPIQSAVWQPKYGGAWLFDLVGIYDGAHKETDTSHLYFRYDYFDETRTRDAGTVSLFVARLRKPDDAARAAKKIDTLFENSRYPTKTESEAALLRGLAGQIGDIGSIVMAILAVVFFTLLLIVGNTVAEGVRERLREFGILKAIGFTNGQVLSLVFAESGLIAFTGGAAGLLLGWLAVSAQNPLRGILPAFVFHPQAIAAGALIVLLLGLAAGALPAIQVMRLNTAEALRTD